MKKLENALRTCRKFYQTYEKQIRIAVIALTVITALLLFGGNGKKDEIIVEPTGETQTEAPLSDDESGGEFSENDSTVAQAEPIVLVVDISGCVKTPGVYETPDGTRLHEVIELAGGLKKKADIDAINQAEPVTDGQKILIPAKMESGKDDSGTASGEISASSGKININQADSMSLQEIPGVGPATADKIIQYRESNGRFQSIEDLKNVSGIGEKTFEKMKDMICV
jgi:competence protein ComEA